MPSVHKGQSLPHGIVCLTPYLQGLSVRQSPERQYDKMTTYKMTIYMHMQIQLQTHTYTHTHTYTFTHTIIHTHTYNILHTLYMILAYMHTACIYIHIHTYAHIHTHAHTCVRTHAYTYVRGLPLCTYHISHISYSLQSGLPIHIVYYSQLYNGRHMLYVICCKNL